DAKRGGLLRVWVDEKMQPPVGGHITRHLVLHELDLGWLEVLRDRVAARGVLEFFDDGRAAFWRHYHCCLLAAGGQTVAWSGATLGSHLTGNLAGLHDESTAR